MDVSSNVYVVMRYGSDRNGMDEPQRVFRTRPEADAYVAERVAAEWFNSPMSHDKFEVVEVEATT